MTLEKYMMQKFPNLNLKPPLFYLWQTGIRFELGVNDQTDCIQNYHVYLKEVYKRAITLFESVHNSNDEIYIVVDVGDYANGKAFQHKLNVFAKYVKEKSLLLKLQHQTIPYMSPEDEEDNFKTQRFILECTPSDFQYKSMIQAICNHEMGIKPSISHRVYFVNVCKNTIFHIYDDRGGDLLATSANLIRHVYEDYHEWILDYDREAIDQIFNEA